MQCTYGIYTHTHVNIYEKLHKHIHNKFMHIGETRKFLIYLNWVPMSIYTKIELQAMLCLRAKNAKLKLVVHKRTHLGTQHDFTILT